MLFFSLHVLFAIKITAAFISYKLFVFKQKVLQWPLGLLLMWLSLKFYRNVHKVEPQKEALKLISGYCQVSKDTTGQ